MQHQRFRIFPCLLTCGHTLLYREGLLPNDGETLWCWRCNAERQAVPNPTEWWARCRARGCHYSRRFGADHDAAKIAADRHSRTCAHPQVDVYAERRNVA